MKLFSTRTDLRVRCGFLPQSEPREFESDHQLLHSWDFQDFLCRLGDRTDWGRVLLQTGHVSASITDAEMRRTRVQLHCQVTILNEVRELQESVRSCSCNALPKLLSTNSELIVECVMRATENGKKKKEKTTTKLSNIRLAFLHFK